MATCDEGGLVLAAGKKTAAGLPGKRRVACVNAHAALHRRSGKSEAAKASPTSDETLWKKK